MSTLAVALLLALALGWPLGVYVARVMAGERAPLTCLVGPWERRILAVAGVDPHRETGWVGYAKALLAFSSLATLVLVGIQRVQHVLPLNPTGAPPVPWTTAICTAVSFVTNTNWQSYAGETAMSHLTQMAGLGVQNFVSAAVGIAVLTALARGLQRTGTPTIGNFWVDLVRATLHVLLPLAIGFALVLACSGVPQSLAGGFTAHGVESGAPLEIPLGPVASQEAIKMLGSNGGGFFNANSAHPFENPTPLTNLLQIVAILLLPIALCTTFGRLVGAPSQGRAILIAMLVIFVPTTLATVHAETHVASAWESLGVDAQPGPGHDGGSLEGKEQRFGVSDSAVFASATTAVSCGAVNAMHDSFTALGGLGPLLLMLLSEVVFGGVGSGLYGMVVFVFVTVFVAGLMVGRTPEYLGKKLGAFEIEMAALALLLPTVAVLCGTALAVSVPAGRASIANPGPHGFTEVLYAWASAGNNNGSAFAGLAVNTPFWELGLAVAMAVGRFGVAVPLLAIAGALASKRRTAASTGTLRTDGALFVALLIAMVLIVGALSFLPALGLGPLAEHFQHRGGR